MSVLHDYPGERKESIALDNTGTTDLALGDIVIPTTPFPNPNRIVIVRIGLICDQIIDSSGGVNRLDGDQHIQIQLVGGSYTNCIKMVNDDLYTQANGVRGGLAVWGIIDVSGTVNQPGTYNIQWTNCKVDGDNLTLYGLQAIARVYYVV